MNNIEMVESKIKELDAKTPLGELKKTIEDAKEVISGSSEEKESKENKDIISWLSPNKKLLEYYQLFSKREELSMRESIKFQLLEVQLSVTCPYFDDFKDFLKELEKGENTNLSEENIEQEQIGQDHIEASESVLLNNKFIGIPISGIKSHPFYKNPKSGVTRCSRTARYNGDSFGLSLPSGDAYDAGQNPGDNCLDTLPSNKKNSKPNARRSEIRSESFPTGESTNFADIYSKSKSNYGHRAVAFKDDTGQWYVLDPYIRVNGIMNNDPKKLEDYAKVRPILKAHFYQSTKYEFKNQSYA